MHDYFFPTLLYFIQAFSLEMQIIISAVYNEGGVNIFSSVTDGRAGGRTDKPILF